MLKYNFKLRIISAFSQSHHKNTSLFMYNFVEFSINVTEYIQLVKFILSL